jgi:hypothetical protein
MRFVDSEQAFREMLEADPLRDYYTDWNSLSSGDVEAFSVALEGATEERALQRFLAEATTISPLISADPDPTPPARSPAGWKGRSRLLSLIGDD